MSRADLVRRFGRLSGHLPTVLAWAALGGLAAFGASHGWTFGGGDRDDDKEKAANKPAEPDPGPFTPYLAAQPGDVGVMVTHDPAHCEVEEKRVVLPSQAVADRAGVRTAPVAVHRLARTVTAHGEAVQDPTAMARVAPRVGGAVVRMAKRVGDPVRAGELLAVIDAGEVGKAKAALLTARANLEGRQRVRDALQSNVAPERSVVEADNALRDARVALFGARQGLVNLGLPLPSAADDTLPDDAYARRLHLLGLPFFARLELTAAEAAGRPPTANLLPVTSPLDGVVTKQLAVAGEPVAALQAVYEVGDPRKVDVYLEVRQEDVPEVALDQAATFRIEGAPSVAPFAGTADWIAPALDETTRTLRVRVRVPNPAGTLRARTFGDGTLTVGPPTPVPAVPEAAVHWEGCSHVVFVKVPAEAGKPAVVFRPRKVTPGVRAGGLVEVRSGLAAGEEIAVAGSHVLKCELLKDRIGDAEE